MTLDTWLESAIADAKRRGLADLEPLLRSLAQAAQALREASPGGRAAADVGNVAGTASTADVGNGADTADSANTATDAVGQQSLDDTRS